MKTSRLFFWLGLLFFAQTLVAQPTEKPPVLWRPGFSIGAAGGYGFFTKSKQKVVIPEVAFPASGAVWNAWDMGYTLRSGWGIRFLANKIAAKPSRENFRRSLEQKFPGYYIQGIAMDALTYTAADQLFLGITFTQSRGKCFLRPALMLGFSEFRYRNARAQAKEQGSNQLYSLEFSRDRWNRMSLQSPTLIAGLKFGYAFARNFGLSTSIDFTTIKHQLRYRYSKIKEIEDTVETEVLSVKYWQVGASLQVGLFLFW